jgi:hypothetical protein
MTSVERAALEKLLAEVTKALSPLAATNGNSHDEATRRLYRMSIDLRRRLSEDAAHRSSHELIDTVSSDSNKSPTAAANREGQSIDRRSQPERPPQGVQVDGFELSPPLARRLLFGVCVLAWVIAPRTSDAPWALSLLMFFRFVPIFIVGGSLCGYTRRGGILGIGLFFGLMAFDSLSLPMWDIQRINPESRKLVRHATNLAGILYFVGAVGLLLTVAAALARRRDKHQAYKRCLRLSLEALIAVQLAFVVELGYTSLRHFTGAERNHAGMIATLKTSPHKSFRSR